MAVCLFSFQITLDCLALVNLAKTLFRNERGSAITDGIHNALNRANSHRRGLNLNIKLIQLF